MVESRRLCVPATAFGPRLETPQHGSWVGAAEREFDVPFTFLLRRATSGAAIGADNIRLHVDSAGTHLSSNFENTITDPAGNSLFTATGTYDATPI